MEETERDSLKTHLLVQDLLAPTSSSPHSESKQGVSHRKKIMKKDASSYPHGGYIQITEESRMEKRSDDGVTNIEVQESTNLEHGHSAPEKDLGVFQ